MNDLEMTPEALEYLETQSPEELEAYSRGERLLQRYGNQFYMEQVYPEKPAPKRSFSFPRLSLPKIPTPTKWGCFFVLLIIGAPTLTMTLPYWITYGFPGQYRGAYQWAAEQDAPTQIDFCRTDRWSEKSCWVTQKGTGSYGTDARFSIAKTEDGWQSK